MIQKEMRREDFPDDASWYKAAMALSPRKKKAVVPALLVTTKQTKPAPKQTPRQVFDAEHEARRAWPCSYRGAMVGDIPCPTCGLKNKMTAVYKCAKHNICTLTLPANDKSLAYCRMCKDRSMGYNELDFKAFNNAFAGQTATVVGKGVTDFNYEDLALCDGPVFFINDAVQMEKYVRHENTFFFALDRRMSVYFPNVKSLPVLKYGGPKGAMGVTKEDQDFLTLKRVLFYRHASDGGEELLAYTRDQIAVEQRLYCGNTNHRSTIVPLTHWLFYAGVTKARYIGCDGLAVGYDPRLANLSNCRPPETVGDKGLERFSNFRREQDMVAERCGIAIEYVGTPVLVTSA